MDSIALTPLAFFVTALCAAVISEGYERSWVKAITILLAVASGYAGIYLAFELKGLGGDVFKVLGLVVLCAGAFGLWLYRGAIRYRLPPSTATRQFAGAVFLFCLLAYSLLSNSMLNLFPVGQGVAAIALCFAMVIIVQRLGNLSEVERLTNK